MSWNKRELCQNHLPSSARTPWGTHWNEQHWLSGLAFPTWTLAASIVLREQRETKEWRERALVRQWLEGQEHISLPSLPSAPATSSYYDLLLRRIV